MFCSAVSLQTTPAHPTVVLSCSFAWLPTFMRMFPPQQLSMTSKKASKKACRAVSKRYLQWLHRELAKLCSTLSCPPLRGDPEVSGPLEVPPPPLHRGHPKCLLPFPMFQQCCSQLWPPCEDTLSLTGALHASSRQQVCTVIFSNNILSCHSFS